MGLIEQTAPSNIALIKYMGKIEGQGNRPTNSSISYTLNHLITKIQATPSAKNQDSLSALNAGEFSLELSEKGTNRFLEFFKMLRAEFQIQGFYDLKSGNNFPSDCGLASSASSFAALTRTAYAIAQSEGLKRIYSDRELASLSQKGSGSSCRSFFTPFSIWGPEGASGIDLGISELLHNVLVLEDSVKAVSSSEAHRRVSTSLVFEGRIERAEKRLENLIASLRSCDWKTSYEICWQEFWDMHALFETSKEPFGYMNGQCLEALKILRAQWQKNGDGPLVTMDAGPNIHLLFRKDQQSLREQCLADLTSKISQAKSAMKVL